MPVALGVHADRGNAEAEEAGVVSGKIGFDRGEVREVFMQDFTKLGVLLPGRAAPDHQHALDAGVEQAFAQHALPDQSGGAEQNHFHRISPRAAALRIQAAAAT